MEQNLPSKSSRSTQGSRSASNKSQKRRNSDTPSSSSSATNDHGRDELDDRLRSVLSHPLGLPLIEALHAITPTDQSFLKRTCPSVLPNDNNLNAILANVVNDWIKNNDHDELGLTKELSKKIEEEFCDTSKKVGEEFKETTISLHSAAEVKVNVDNGQGIIGHGFIDILLSSGIDASTAKPLALIEVGRQNSDWWKKLDQNVTYLKAMLGTEQTEECVKLDLDKPVLLAVLTIDKEDTEQFRVKFGVFLCTPKGNNDFRMTLIWHTLAPDLQEASIVFGRFLRVTYCFAGWRETNDDEYSYLSSNCCRVGDSVSAGFGLLLVSYYTTLLYSVLFS